MDPITREIRLAFGKRYPAVPVGKTDEHVAQRVRVDCRGVLGRWPEALFSVHLQRYGEGAYVAHGSLTADDGGWVDYDLTAADVGVAGVLLMEVRARDGGVRVSSATYELMVEPGLYMGAPGAPRPGWADAVIDAGAAAEEGARVAVESAAVAEACAQSVVHLGRLRNVEATAAGLGWEAEATVTVRQTEDTTTFDFGIPSGYVSLAAFEMDPADGCLYVHLPGNGDGVGFLLDRETGMLAVYMED